VELTRAQRIAHLAAAGNRYRLEGRPTLAEPLLREALELTESEFPGDRDRLAGALNALGLLYKDLAKYDEARACYERALSLLNSFPDSQRADVATLYHNLGGIEHARKDSAAAESFARRGLEIRRASAPADDSTLAGDMVALAAILDGQGKFDEAEALYVVALGILEKDPAANARELAVALNDLGANYARRDRLDDANTQLATAVELKTRQLGVQHPDRALSLNNLGFVHERQGDIDRAAELYAEALRVFEQSLGHDHPKTRDCRRNYERALAVSSRM
jgi:tetratricopeptide (TPR) repeat protein